MDEIMNAGTGDGGLDAVFEAALLGEEEPQEDAELNEEPENGKDTTGSNPARAGTQEGNNPPEGEPGAGGGEGGGEPPEGNNPPQAATVDVGGARVPADALRLVSQTLGQDAGELIRRGMEYDAKAGRELSILNDFAAMAGMELPEYLTYLEQARDEQAVSAEMEKIRGRYPEGTPDEALRDIAKNMVLSRRAQAQQARQAAEQQAAAMQRQAAESERDGAMRREIESFRAAHPEIKGSADVPQEVWDAINASGGTLGLNAAFTAYERDQAKAEAEKLREQLAAAQKNQANRAQSMGSMEGAGEDDMDAEFKRIMLS